MFTFDNEEHTRTLLLFRKWYKKVLKEAERYGDEVGYYQASDAIPYAYRKMRIKYPHVYNKITTNIPRETRNKLMSQIRIEGSR